MEFFQQNIIPGEVIVQLLAFLIVFGTLKKLAWGPILEALEARRNKIQSDVLQNESARKELDSMKADYEAHLKRIDEEARAKIQEAVEEGRRLARDIQEQARGEAQATFEKTKENLSLEISKARIQMRRDIANLTIQVTERILQEKLTDAKQQEKILGIIDELESAVETGGNK